MASAPIEIGTLLELAGVGLLALVTIAVVSRVVLLGTRRDRAG
jgi:hypothetical protein